MKPWIIGLNNPLSDRPRDALVPWPGRCAGARLVEMATAVDPTFDDTEYMDSFVLRNLWPGRVLPAGKGSEKLYRVAAAELRREIELAKPRAVLLLGSRVAAMIGSVKQWQVFTSFTRDGCAYWYLAHPSGRCFVYNDPDKRRRCGEILVSVARQRLKVARRSHG